MARILLLIAMTENVQYLVLLTRMLLGYLKRSTGVVLSLVNGKSRKVKIKRSVCRGDSTVITVILVCLTVKDRIQNTDKQIQIGNYLDLVISK